MSVDCSRQHLTLELKCKALSVVYGAGLRLSEEKGKARKDRHAMLSLQLRPFARIVAFDQVDLDLAPSGRAHKGSNSVNPSCCDPLEHPREARSLEGRPRSKTKCERKGPALPLQAAQRTPLVPWIRRVLAFRS